MEGDMSETDVLDELYVAEACRRAAGEEEVPAEEPLISVLAAKRDISARGMVRERWYRLALTPGSQEPPRYFSREREPWGMVRAADRHWEGWGEVPAGTVLLQHDYGGPVQRAKLVVRAPEERLGYRLVTCGLIRRADGQLGITLPGGQQIVLPDPRRQRR